MTRPVATGVGPTPTVQADVNALWVLAAFGVFLVLDAPSALAEVSSSIVFAVFVVAVAAMVPLAVRHSPRANALIGWFLSVLLLVLVMLSVLLAPGGQLGLAWLPTYAFLVVPILITAVLCGDSARLATLVVGVLCVAALAADYALQPHATDLIADTRIYGWYSNLARAEALLVIVLLIALGALARASRRRSMLQEHVPTQAPVPVPVPVQASDA